MLDQLWSFLTEQLKHNQFLTGGFLIGMLAGLVHWGKALPKRLWDKIVAQFFIEVDIEDKDEIFLWMVKWLAAHPYSLNRARSLMVTSESAKCGSLDTRPTVIFSPARGRHWFIYRGRFVSMYRGNDDGSPTTSGSPSAVGDKMFKRETITVKILTRNRNIVRQLIEDAREITHPKGERRISIMVHRYGSWSTAMLRRPRPLDTVILRAGLMESMVEAIEKFRTDQEYYFARGIPYRLGIGLEGPPGSGKSSTIAAVASHFNMNLAILNLASSSLTDEELVSLLSNIDNNTMVIIEDVDCVFNEREATEDNDSKVTFSGLLNAIDGVASGEGRILWMTTNHPEKLDPALTRPGRCDLWFDIGTPDVGQLCRMFARFYPEAKPSETLRFVEAVPDLTKTSMAAVQGLLVRNKNDYEAAIRHAPEICKL